MSEIRETVEQRLSQKSARQEQTRRFAPDPLGEHSQGASTWCRPALIWLFAACVPGLIISVASYFFAVGPLEKRLQEMQVLQTARSVDATVQIRAAAVQIAARSRASANLVETDELDRLLQGLRSSFPDFLSMEILDEHGEILAMVGELPLSDAVRSVGKSKTAKVGAMSYRKRDLFRDDPEADSFLITARHQAEEGRLWFSRTRFARDPIRKALASAPEGTTVTLVPVADRESDGSAQKGRSQGLAGSASNVQLNVPGWALKVERKSAVATFSWGAAIAAGIVVLVISLAFAYRRFSSSRQSGGMDVWAGIQCLFQRRVHSGFPIMPEESKETSSRDPDPESFQPNEQDDRPDDTWTPRNVPLGFREPESREVSESALKLEHDEPDARAQCKELEEARDGCYCECEPQGSFPPLQSTEVGSVPALTSESVQAAEAVDITSPPVVALALADAASEMGSFDGISHEDIPEVLEVAWLEPLDDEPSQFQLSPGKQP